ncbi:MAG: amidohydrolase family protein [Anaerolineales bacterium]
MENVDLILKNANIVTMDSEYRVLPHGAIAIQDDHILFVGTEEETLKDFSAAETVDCSGKVVIPGLINGHTHAAMTLLRGLADDLRLDVWLLGYMMPVEREFVSPEFSRLGTQIACAEMIRSGITCFADMYYYEETVAQAVADAGMRAICGQTILKFPSPDAESYEDSLELARGFIERWKDHPLVVPAVAPHAPYTCTPEILKACTEIALEYDVPLHTHIAETFQEVEDWREAHSMPVVPWVKKIGLLDAKVIAAHCVHIDDGEIHTLEHAGTGVVHNPSSNMKLASGFAPVSEMLERGVNVGIGTDGPASNNDLDLFEEVRLASFIAKAVTKDPTALPARQAFEMATRNGAKAIHMDHLIGSLEAGKKADLVIVDLDLTHNQPHFEHDPNAIYSRLIYAAKSTDVLDVMIAGRWVMQDRKLLHLDEADLIAQAASYAARIDTFLVEREESVLSKLIAIGGAEQEESYEVQIKLSLPDPDVLIDKLSNGNFEILRTAHYIEYDSYFTFPSPEETRLRYREDEFINEDGEIFNVRSRLTLTGPAAEHEYQNSVLLSRSRFIAPAIYSPRFYREYFKPIDEVIVHKDRLRWLIKYQGVEFFINIDKVLEPQLEGSFLEIKSRTWSRHDAERKAELITNLVTDLELERAEAVGLEYPNLVSGKS